MTGPAEDRSTRLVRWWVRRYTAGLHPSTAAIRRAEIESDLAEHERARRDAGWPASQLVRERLRRALAGVPADLTWRRDRLRAGAGHQRAASAVGLVTAIAQLLLAAYCFAFATYLLGETALADRAVFGRFPLAGFTNYEDAPGASTGALIIGACGLVLVASCIARPLAPIVSNVVVMPIAMLATMFFWLGVWPLGMLVLAGASIDLALHARQPAVS